MNIVETRGLCKQYGQAMRVKQLNLSVPEGAVYGFLGPNGAGKSTTLKMVLGLAKPTAGEITVFGKHVNPHNRIAILKQVGSLIESPSYYGHLTGEENLRIVQTLRGAPEKDIQEVLSIVRLDGQKGKQVAHYSLGMKQRLGLAAALLGFPKLLILDEPTNGLDPAGIQEMRELICSLPGQFGMTVLVSSHLLSEIDQMADHVGIIREGELVFQDTLAALHARSRHHLALRTTDNGEAARLLGESRIPCTLEEGYLILPLLTDADAAKLSRFLAAHRVDLLRMEERQKSLEDIFLELTGKAASL
ncbi:ATP-binding cassette domain-containing protein [Flavonifractor sp. An10]|uniref:ATP-binding cassette domain-containing protein n=1 Tax=Flavonifractor sp. An10 TaxID=1965537 RepID=UPI000B36B5AC|nr:ATP-binding cassette domain-containing protein [Flavonifractor sp. An10]OUQ80489.1 bacitracin ABC transporter ATP-binding protein [Flavonifractor sp. An10]